MSKKVLVIYDSAHGLVQQMSTVVASGIRAEGVEAVCEHCDSVSIEDFEKYDAIVVGSPCHFAGVSSGVKKLLDSTYGIQGKLEGKVGAAFTASGHIGGGNELTLRSIIDFFLIHGMIVQGDPKSDHFGAVVVNSEGEIVTDTSGECHRLGQRVAALVNRLG